MMQRYLPPKLGRAELVPARTTPIANGRRRRSRAVPVLATVMLCALFTVSAEPSPPAAQAVELELHTPVTYNMQGGSAGNVDKWNSDVLPLSSNHDVVALQEAGPAAPGVLVGQVNTPEGLFQHTVWNAGTSTRPRFLNIYFLETDPNGRRVNLAIVLGENPAEDWTTVAPGLPAGRGALGVKLGGTWFYTIHALSGGGNDAAGLLTNIGLNPVSGSFVAVLGDFNRDPASLVVPAGLTKYTSGQATQRSGGELDYMVSNDIVDCESGDVEIEGRLMNALSSDHFPVEFPVTECEDEEDPLPDPTPGRTAIRAADPSTIRVGDSYYSAEVVRDGAGIGVRRAPTLQALATVEPVLVYFDDRRPSIWAPEIVNIDGRFYVYYAASYGGNRRMYAISGGTLPNSPFSGWASEGQMALPDDKWAIDGTTFVFGNQRYFVWSGWEGDTDVEQNLYIARMTSPTQVTGPRYAISQPREDWERVVGNPFINEAPEGIVDPNGQLHILYSANGSWSDQYCLADLRLKAGGDPTYVWDWHKSDGCLFGSNGGTMQQDWYPTLFSNGPGHHTFVLENGDISKGPPYGIGAPIMYHAVPKGMDYEWANRVWHIGKFTWYPNINYNRCCVPGENTETGYSPMFFEDPTFRLPPNPAGPPAGAPGVLSIRNADPSVMRVGGTYISVESVGNRAIAVREASSTLGLDDAQPITIWEDTGGLGEVWAPEIVLIDGRYFVYFSAGSGRNHRMYVMSSSSSVSGWGTPRRMVLPGGWAVDGTTFEFDGERYFVWSGWEGDTDIEQNLYIAEMLDPATVVADRTIISQPRESWERVVGQPFINEAPAPIKDPSGQLHIVYSANGSWSDQYCMADLRLRAGGDPTYVWDWYKSNGCQFGSNDANMMPGWDETLHFNGTGSNSFVLENGDISTSPPAGPEFPLMYHAVPKGTPYSWANRQWVAGTFEWYAGSQYTRCCVPGDTSSNGWGLKFYEDPY